MVSDASNRIAYQAFDGANLSAHCVTWPTRSARKWSSVALAKDDKSFSTINSTLTAFVIRNNKSNYKLKKTLISILKCSQLINDAHGCVITVKSLLIVNVAYGFSLQRFIWVLQAVDHRHLVVGGIPVRNK